MKIWKLEQLKQQTHLDERVLTKAEEILKVLNVHYGDERLVTDLGGYILLAEEEIHDFINQYPTLIPHVRYRFMFDSSLFVYIQRLISSGSSPNRSAIRSMASI